MTKKLQKGAFFGDIHFGKKANSKEHNEDCLKYLDWFCDNVKKEKCDYIAFLGDWNENRSALNVATLNYSYQGAKKLNQVGVPVFFVVGNHDCFYRHSREIYSIVPFKEFNNFIVIDEPTVVNDIEGAVLFAPYLFHEEYPSLLKYSKIPFWAGHFEFKGFYITGYNMIMPNGPDPKDFKDPKHIVSGHFHKRQANGNVVYIGNTFPMDFSDAGDTARGMMIYNHIEHKMTFHDWNDGPKYFKVKLSSLLDNQTILCPQSYVNCEVDVPITFEESNYLHKKFVEDYKLRDFTLEESHHITTALTETETAVNIDDIKLTSIDDLVAQMLDSINTEHIDNNLLVKIYRDIRI